MLISTIKRENINYFIHRNGWACLFASIPLLFFISVPFFLKEVLGLDFSIIALEYLVSLRVIRFFRILRFVGEIYNPKSIMLSRHISIVNLFVTTSTILFFLLIGFLQDIDIIDSTYKKVRIKEIEITKNYLSIFDKVEEKQFLNYLNSNLTNFPEVALIKFKDNVFSNYDMEKIKENNKYFYLEDSLTENMFQIIFLRKSFYSDVGLTSMIYFSLIIFLISFVTIFYKNYFYNNIVTPILIMKKGFEDINFVKGVNIPECYKTDEIYILSSNYNLRWLEAKKRKLKDLKISGLTVRNK